MIAYSPTTARDWDDDYTSATTTATHVNGKRINSTSVVYLYPDQFFIKDTAREFEKQLSKEELLKWIQIYIHRSNRITWREKRKDIKKFHFKNQIFEKPDIMYRKTLFSKSGFLPGRMRRKLKGS